MTPWMKANRDKIPALMNRKRRGDKKPKKPEPKERYFVRQKVEELIAETEARQRRIAKARELNQAAMVNARMRTLERKAA